MSAKNMESQIKDISSLLKSLSISPTQIMVIIGILSDSFEVDSILVDKNQEVQILLTGSLKQKTQLDQIMDQIGKQPFDEVMKAIVGRLI